MPQTTRRAFLVHVGLTAAGSVVLDGCLPACDPAQSGCGIAPTDAEPTPEGPPAPCDVTADNIEGPFYRPDSPSRVDLNVLDQEGASLLLEGRVWTEGCAVPLAGAIVEVWHCGPAGQYDEESETFEFRGQATTDGEGRYRFETLFPGRYLNGGVYRPAHVHYKVSAADHTELTTQLYFQGDPFLEDDSWALDSLTMPVADVGPDAFQTSFDVVLAAVT